MTSTETVRGADEPRRGKARKRLLPRLTPAEALGDDEAQKLPPASRPQWPLVLDMRKVCLSIAVKYVPRHQREDVWQETKLAMWQKLLDGPVEKPRAYVQQVCRNQAKQHLRKIKTRAEELIGDIELLASGVPDLHPEADVRVKDLVCSFDGVLTSHEALICVLRWGEKLDSDTVAKLVGPPTTASSVRQALRRARTKLDRPGVRERVAHRIRTGE